jgi:V8-like Glu-specific endopeptidase
MKNLLAAGALLALGVTSVHAGSTVHFRNPDLSPTGEIPAVRDTRDPKPLARGPSPNQSRVKPDLTATVDPTGGSGIQPRANGSHGIPYTSTRVQGGTSRYSSSVGANYLSTTYPYRAVGLITFNVGSDTNICTGTLIRRGIVLTAAHCIQEFGGGTARYANWDFTPGNWSPAGATATQAAPYGTWQWQAIEVPASWTNGTDTGDGTAVNNDVALIALKRNTAGQHAGQIVGTIDYATGNYGFVRSPITGNLWVAMVTTLGYPGLLDSGERMQRTDSPTYLTTVDGALQMTQGSDFTGGASGGPWIVNFWSVLPVRTGGAVIGANSNRRVIGVTSWGAAGANVPKDNYASRLGQNAEFPLASYGTYGAGNIGALMNRLCSRATTGGTYASLGYCSQP